MPHSLFASLFDRIITIDAGPVVIPLFVGAVACWLLALGHRRGLTAGRVLTVLATCAYGAAVVALTLFPLQIALGRYGNQAAWYDKINVIPFVTIDPQGFLLNIAMTAPLGVLLPLISRVRTPAGAALVGLVVSSAIELAQGAGNILLSSGRTADVNDLLANVAGAVLGFALVGLISRRVPRLAAPLSALALPGSALNVRKPTSDEALRQAQGASPRARSYAHR